MNSFSTKYQLRENALVIGVFFVLVHLFYAKTWQAGFVTDFTGLQERLDGAPFSDFLNCFGFPALHQVTNFFLFLFYKCFGTSPLPWYLIYTTLHVVNGWLGYLLVKGLSAPPAPKGDAGWLNQISLPAFLTAILFLISPYNAETVIWKVCFNFLFCTAMMLSSLLFLVKYLGQKKKSHLIYCYSLFTIALFTFELALALPLMALVLILWKSPSASGGQLFRRPALLASTPYFILSGIYFLLNKIILGKWVGHYGENVHLNFDIKTIAANCLKYFSKNSLYWREWGHGLKQSFISFCENPLTAYAFLLSGITILLALFVFHKRLNSKIRSITFSWILFFLALAPISNLYVAWILHGENDRYGYFASIFFYAALVFTLQFLNKNVRLFFYCCFLFVSVYNLNKINNYWKNSTEVVLGLLDNFRWENNSEIYILAFPENYQGVPMFKDFSRKDLALKSALKYLAKKKSEGQFYQVGQFNMSTPPDGLSATVDSTNLIKMEFHEWGSWWWRHGIGTGNYSTDKYDFKTVGKGCEVIIKKTAKDAVFIYSDGDKWKEVFLNTGTQ